MKKSILVLLALAVVGFMTSCEKSLEEDFNVSDIQSGSITNNSSDDSLEVIPPAIQTYIDTNYPGLIIVKAEVETDPANPAVAFEVELNDGTDVYFDIDGNFLFDEAPSGSGGGGGGSGTNIPIASLPTIITDYVTLNYPDAIITEAKVQDNGVYKVELNNGLELYFDASGNFLALDTDDDNISIASLPAAITNYVAANYPDAVIIEAEIEDDGLYEVELNNGLELYFDASGNFLFEDNDDDGTCTLSVDINDYIAINYPANTIVDCEVFATGYIEVELDNDWKVYFDPSEVFLFEDADNDMDIPVSSLPAAITAYLSANYAGIAIDQADVYPSGFYEVKLVTDVDVIFDPAGNFLFEDN